MNNEDQLYVEIKLLFFFLIVVWLCWVLVVARVATRGLFLAVQGLL